MWDKLVVPEQFPGLSIERDHGIGVQVNTRPGVVIKIGRRVAAGQIKDTLLSVVGLRRPQGAACMLARFRIWAPSVGSGLAILGNDIKFPDLLSIAQTKRADPSAAGTLGARG